MTWAEYVVAVTGTTNQSQIHRECGVSQSQIGRWFAGAEPRVSSVLKFARHYDLDLTEAFLAAAGEEPMSRTVPSPRRG